ncbi:MAG: hypothetical protein J6M22_06375 [Firmicutes bacterium]|nr:hypothetical protein [Bacillota bacterium]
MGRGMLTGDEIRILMENPYVEAINGSRIVYSEEFKRLFVKEYFEGKKPMRIFQDAGFDVKVLGSKRIERCSARWREANASGTLGRKHADNDFFEKNENEKQMMRRTIEEQQQEIDQLKEKIEHLSEVVQELQAAN